MAGSAGQLGGKLLTGSFSLSRYGVVALVGMADNAAAAAFAIAASAGGAVTAGATMPLKPPWRAWG